MASPLQVHSALATAQVFTLKINCKDILLLKYPALTTQLFPVGACLVKDMHLKHKC